MPKKTAYSRGGAQRSKTRQKSFELVRPTPTPEVPAATESRADAEDVEEETTVEKAGEEQDGAEETTAEERVAEVAEKSGKRTGAAGRAPMAVTAAAPPQQPKSAASRMAARRQAAPRAQRSAASLIVAENYGYVRKDLIFILILAVIMFSAIIALHFVLSS